MRDLGLVVKDVAEMPRLPSNRTGRIEARFEHIRGVTQLTHSFHRAPLKIAKAFPQDDGSLHVCTMDCSPGLLSGDRYELDFHVAQNARVYLTNQSFTRVHPARRPDDISRQQQHITLEDGAVLELFPEPMMLFRNAAAQFETHIEMSPQSTLMLSDITCAGRIARGEKFDFKLWQNRLDIRMNGELIFCNRQRLRPQLPEEQHNLTAAGAWSDYTHWGNFWIFGEHVSQHGAQLLEALREAFQSHQQVLCGASLTAQSGIAVTMMGHHAWQLQQVAEDLRSQAKNNCQGL
jgi:urease accessory protein